MRSIRHWRQRHVNRLRIAALPSLAMNMPRAMAPRKVMMRGTMGPKAMVLLEKVQVRRVRVERVVRGVVVASVVVVAVAAAVVAAKVAVRVETVVLRLLAKVAEKRVERLLSRRHRRRCRVISRLVISRGISRVVMVRPATNPGMISLVVIVAKAAIARAVDVTVVEAVVVGVVAKPLRLHRSSLGLRVAVQRRRSRHRHPSRGRCMVRFVASFPPAS